MKIILVDDEPMALDGISRMLHWERFDGQLVGCAADGQEAVELLEKHHPDVVVSDIRMPGMDGLALSRYVYEHTPNTRMILISGHGEFEYAQQALQYQVTDYILKPITREKLNSLEERLAAIRDELLRDEPPWYVGDQQLRERVTQALHKGDMAAMGELLISQDVRHSLSERRDVLGIQLLNYLFSYQEELGIDQKCLDAMRRKAILGYWRLTDQQQRLTYLAAQYYDLMELAENRKEKHTGPIVSYCLQAIEEHYTDANFNISNLAEMLHLSLPYLSTVFKNATNQTISSYLSSKRLERAPALLQDPAIPIKKVCWECGYSDPRYFAKLFKKHSGMTPSEYRNLHAGGTQGLDDEGEQS